MSDEIVLTGVKPTHIPHLGNYLGAIRPGIELSNNYKKSLLFIADAHALTTVHDSAHMKEYTYKVTATWLACGVDPKKTIVYRQSDVPEIFELSWILSCFCAKGLMNRAHAYKGKIAENEESGKKDLDFGVSMGLFTYPILMAADILMFGTHTVPVGEDQVQHVEYARDIAQKLNGTFNSELLTIPKAYLKPSSKLIPGLDGRKMSKSYGNHIPLFLDSKSLRKLIMKIKTDSSEPEEPKETKGSLLFDLYKEFASEDQVDDMAKKFAEGIGWGYVKQDLFEAIEQFFVEKKKIFDHLIAHPNELEEILQSGASRAREMAKPRLQKIKSALY